MERREYGVGGKPQRLVAQDPQEPQGFYPVTKVCRLTTGPCGLWILTLLQPCEMQCSVPISQMTTHRAQGLRFLPGDPLTVTCDFNSSERGQPTPAGSGSAVRVFGVPVRRWPAAVPAAAVKQGRS